ncbi:MAG: hypothetical protein WCL07_00025 [bacterium]
MGSLIRLVFLIAIGLGGLTLYNTYRSGQGFSVPALQSEANKTVSQATVFTQTTGSVLGAMVEKSGLLETGKKAAETAQYTYCQGVITNYEKTTK